MARIAIESRPRRAGSAFTVFLLGSVAVHAAVLAGLPGYEREDRPQIAAVLEVVLLSATPLPVIPRETAARSAPARPQGARRPLKAMTEAQDRQRPPISLPSEPPEPESTPFAVEAPAAPDPKLYAPVQSPRDKGVASKPASSHAAYLSNPAPRYPEIARRSGEQGTVTLRVRVARDGAAARVVVEKSSGSPHLDAAALEAVKAWRFTPARRGADAIESWILVPIVFRLEGVS